MHSERLEILKAIINSDLKDEYLELRIAQAKGSMKSHFINEYSKADELIQKCKDSNHIYFGLATRKDTTSGKKENCKHISTLWVDIDCGKTGHKKESFFSTKQDALAHISRINFKPSCIIDSGNGLHVYWFLTEPLPLTDANVKVIERLNKQLECIYGGDSIGNIGGILRVPYTFNIKDNETKECLVIEFNPNNRYSIEEIEKLDITNLRLERLKTKFEDKINYYDSLFGKNLEKFNTEDRSVIDQSIITKLLSIGFSEDQVKLIFKLFPTTGKYSEHNSPDAYLNKSIENATNYLGEQNNHYKNEVLEEFDPQKFISRDPIGYVDDGHLLTNFIIEIEQVIKVNRNDEVNSLLNGKLIYEDGSISFRGVSSEILVDTRKFKTFIAKLEPIKTDFFTLPATVIDIVKVTNQSCPRIQETEFGFNKQLTEYVTENFRITKDGFCKEKTPIKHSEKLVGRKLSMQILDESELQEIKKILLKDFLKFQSFDVMSNALAFVALPIIKPFISEHRKPYLFLRGTTGTGKTFISELIQQFYGNFPSLISCSSTSTAINIIGEAFKDALYVVDDIKAENFKREREQLNFGATLQNYADETFRQTALPEQKLSDRAPISGILVLNGEDIVFPQSSTIARGMFITVNRTDDKTDLVMELQKHSYKLNGLTPHFIKYVLDNYDKEKIENLFNKNREFFQKIKHNDPFFNFDNFPRTATSFAMVKTAWQIILSFLAQDSEQESELNVKYNSRVSELFLENLKLSNSSSAHLKFEQLLWTKIEDGTLYLEELNDNKSEFHPPYNGKIKVGYYSDNDDKLKIAIKLDIALREIKKYAPDITISIGALQSKLLQENKIKINSSEKVSFKTVKRTAVEWIGSFPGHIFGIEDRPDIIEAAEQIINDYDDFVDEEFRDVNKSITNNLNTPRTPSVNLTKAGYDSISW